MNEATEQRHALAAQIAANYAASPKVAAVALAGSVAREWADHHSDIELDVYWAAPPTDADRQELIARAGSRIDLFWAAPPSREEHQRLFDRTGGKIGQLWPWEPDEWSEHYYVRDISVGISGFVIPTIERHIEDVLVHHTTKMSHRFGSPRSRRPCRSLVLPCYASGRPASRRTRADSPSPWCKRSWTWMRPGGT